MVFHALVYLIYLDTVMFENEVHKLKSHPCTSAHTKILDELRDELAAILRAERGRYKVDLGASATRTVALPEKSSRPDIGSCE